VRIARLDIDQCLTALQRRNGPDAGESDLSRQDPRRRR
jgi:hypothetical protein